MPFDETAPFQGTDGAPNHKPGTAALYRAANGLYLEGFDGDPPTRFVSIRPGTPDNERLVVHSELDAAIAGVGTISQAFPFFFRGDVSVSTSDYAHFIVNTWTVAYAIAYASVAPTTSAVTLNFLYKGNAVLNTVITIPAGSAAGAAFFSTDFAIPTLTTSGSLDLDRRLVAQCLLEDSGDTAANISCALVCNLVIP